MIKHCRFQNTLSDLRDCINAIEDRDRIGPEERAAVHEMVDASRDLLVALNVWCVEDASDRTVEINAVLGECPAQ